MGEAKNKLESKKEAFEKDPEMFVNMSDCIVIVKYNSDKQLEMLCGCNTLEEIAKVKMELDLRLDAQYIKLKNEQNAKKIQIVKPNIII